jgi:hypothetical protein
MKYTVILQDKTVFYTDWYDYENDWTEENWFMILNNISLEYTLNGKDWIDIEENHL